MNLDSCMKGKDRHISLIIAYVFYSYYIVANGYIQKLKTWDLTLLANSEIMHTTKNVHYYLPFLCFASDIREGIHNGANDSARPKYHYMYTCIFIYM